MTYKSLNKVNLMVKGEWKRYSQFILYDVTLNNMGKSNQSH